MAWQEMIWSVFLIITGPSVSGLVSCVWLDEWMLDVVMLCICL